MKGFSSLRLFLPENPFFMREESETTVSTAYLSLQGFSRPTLELGELASHIIYHIIAPESYQVFKYHILYIPPEDSGTCPRNRNVQSLLQSPDEKRQSTCLQRQSKGSWLFLTPFCRHSTYMASIFRQACYL